MTRTSTLIVLLLLYFISQPAMAQIASGDGNEEILDQIVAVVNDQVILKSEVDQRVMQYLQQQQQQQMFGQQPDFSEDLWYATLESLVDSHVLAEKAEIDSVIVSEEEVSRALDQQLDMMIQQAGGEQQVEQHFGMSLLEVREEFRDQFRREMLVQRMREEKLGQVQITRPEVREFFEGIPEEELPMIPEQVELAQIVIEPPTMPEARDQARDFARQLRDSIVTHNVPIEELARRHSDGPTASRGGDLPMMPIDDLLPSYSAAASALDEGEISEVVETRDGFHVIRLDERTGDRVSTTHILIEVEEEDVDEQYAINQLEAIRDSITNQSRRFDELARRHSQDPMTASAGGRMLDPQQGSRQIQIDNLDSDLAERLTDMEPGEITEPMAFELQEHNPQTGQFQETGQQAYRIVKLRERIPEHRANMEQDYDLIRRQALQQKRQRVFEEWLEELREEEVYVEFRIPMPEVDEDIDLMPDQPVEQDPPVNQQQNDE